MTQTEIRIENARSHNLKGVDCRIPIGRLTVVTGVSGSGKSTLAFDTLYAEGQRRYVTSLSAYARQFLERLPRPEVDSISNLPPAIAIEQRNRVTNARSTVGTATEILDHLRVLFARAGETRCPDCDLPVEPGTVAAVADRIAAAHDGEAIAIAAPLAGFDPRERDAFFETLLREGYGRLLDRDGRVVDLAEGDPGDRLDPTPLLLVDRLRVSGEEDAVTRLREAVAAGFQRGLGELVVAPRKGERSVHREGFHCAGCGRRFAEPTPALFSFDSPLGACRRCEGFGRTAGLDLDKVIPDPSLTIEEGPIAPFQTRMGRAMQDDLLAACEALSIPTDVPFEDLDEDARARVIEGDGDDWYGVRGFFDWLEGRRYKVQARVLIARYRRFDRCPDCAGTRLCDDARAVRVAGRDLGELGAMTLGALHAWVREIESDVRVRTRAARVVEPLRVRLATAEAVGLDYLALDRQVRTLSGGEAQRIQLATALGGSLTSALYVLDEPSIGLHACDMERLLHVLLAIRDQGNTVVVVEHAPELIAAADHVIDLGPGAGRQGGALVVEGTVDDVRASAASKSGLALRGELAGLRKQRPVDPAHALRIVGARENNLDDVTVDIPLGGLVVVTGPSGAGKSSLVRKVLVESLPSDGGRVPDPVGCERIEGAEVIAEVVLVDQTPGVRSPRSNPATVSKAFDAIRQRFAATREAKARGLGPGWFSFNVAGGRCDACEGAGELVIDMQFLDDVRVPCEHCGGTRYRRDAREIRVDGRTIVDVLGLTLTEAMEVFKADRRVVERLEPFVRVGLGYLGLGQPLSTLSGGEHQRVRLAQALAGDPEGSLFVFDEPTTGLHPADIVVLLECFDALLDGGASVVLVEHNLDVIRQADWVIDLGPGGGPAGGRVVAQGTPEAVAAAAESLTGAALRGRSAPG